jgi:hypothetical protein
MRVKIEFDGSQVEFEQFCQTPQRMAQAQMLQHYQELLQQPYPIEIEASPVLPTLPGQAVGAAHYRETPLALPAGAGVGSIAGWGQAATMRSAWLPSSPSLGWQHWLAKIELTGPVKFFLLSLFVSIGVVGAIKWRPPIPQAATHPSGQFTVQPIKAIPKNQPPSKKSVTPQLPLIPRPGQE